MDLLLCYKADVVHGWLDERVRIVGIRGLAIAKVVIAIEWIWPYAGSCEFLVDHWMKGVRS